MATGMLPKERETRLGIVPDLRRRLLTIALRPSSDRERRKRRYRQPERRPTLLMSASTASSSEPHRDWIKLFLVIPNVLCQSGLNAAKQAKATVLKADGGHGRLSCLIPSVSRSERCG
jgi:hypothetical protein